MEEKLIKRDLDVIVNMKNYGDGFIQALADCLYNANPQDFEKLKEAFPEYWKKYKNFKP